MAWYDDGVKLRDFANALEQAEAADESEVLKKPYKFEGEYQIWEKNNFPSPEDGEWDEFINDLNAASQGE